MKNINLISMYYVTGIYFVSLAIGLLISKALNNDIAYVPEDINNTHVFFSTFLSIVINNMKVFIIILTGFFLLKIPTVISLISNGSMLGFFLGSITFDQFKHVIIPLSVHGIPEVLGFLIAAYLVFQGKENFMKDKRFNTLLLTSGVLIIGMAAALETYISPIFIK